MGAVAALALAACGGSGSNGPNASSTSGAQRLQRGDHVHRQPVDQDRRHAQARRARATATRGTRANMYYAFCWDMQPPLHAHADGLPGASPGPTQAVPDLATRPPASTTPTSRRGPTTSRTASSGRTARPVTSADVKYGIERLFATDVFATGAGFYYTCLLDTCDSDGTRRTRARTRTRPASPQDASRRRTTQTIVFHLNAVDADFDYLMSLPDRRRRSRRRRTPGKAYTNNVLLGRSVQVRHLQPGQVGRRGSATTSGARRRTTIRKPMVDKVDLTHLLEPGRRADAASQDRRHRPRGRRRRPGDVPGADRRPTRT